MNRTMVRRLGLGMALVATALAGAAYAEQAATAQRGFDGDGVVTRAEAQARAAAMFQRLDVNHDGKLDPADREARRQMRFDRLDTDKNGQLSRAEFFARPERSDGGEGGKGHEWGDGHRGWDRHGGDHHGGPGHHHRGGGFRGMMGKAADTNQDGAVGQAEFTAAALQRFDRADANKDGQVTREERQAARQAMRQEMRERWQNRPASAPALTPGN